jgi:subtilase family serine protease
MRRFCLSAKRFAARLTTLTLCRRRLIFTALLSAVVALGGAHLAQAQAVERSDNVFHKRVCPGPAGPGRALCHAHVVTHRSGDIITNATPAGYGPPDLQDAYNVVHAVDPNAVPTGPLIAIVDAYGYPHAESDLAVYRQQYGLPPCTTANGCFTKVNQNGGTKFPKADIGWDQEQALDLAMVSAICPECRILLVEASSNTFSNIVAAVNQAAAITWGAHAISNSYGAGESGTAPYEPAYNHPGIAITVSSGDSGYAAGTEFPASSPHVTAVGGTRLVRSTSSRGWTETAWAFAGSGCSKVYAKPIWQLDGGCSGRMVADVSATASPSHGVAVYGPVRTNSSGWMVFGGTSVGAPLIAAIYGLNGGSVDYGSDPYPGAGSKPAPYATSADLNVITSGNNGSCNGSYFCTASTKWNYNGPAGLGTPNGAAAFGGP